MYSERVSIVFCDHVSQSARMAYLAGLADALEKVASPNTENPGFSIAINSNGKSTVVIWHPWKRDVLFFQLKQGREKDLFVIESPKTFSQDL